MENQTGVAPYDRKGEGRIQGSFEQGEKPWRTLQNSERGKEAAAPSRVL
jgi:hypothetical protein